MNYEATFNYVVLITTSLMGLVVRTLYKRIDVLEADLKDKLDKQDYAADQEVIIRRLDALQQNMIELPHRIISLLKDTGKL